MLSAYLRLLIFLLEILIPACASSSPAFLMMYSAYKLNNHGDNIQPWHTPFPWTPFPWRTPWTLSTFAPILNQSLLHVSPFVNMHAPPKPSHEYACTLSLNLLWFCCSGDTALGKIPGVFFTCYKWYILPSPGLYLGCIFWLDIYQEKNPVWITLWWYFIYFYCQIMP